MICIFEIQVNTLNLVCFK